MGSDMMQIENKEHMTSVADERKKRGSQLNELVFIYIYTHTHRATID